MVSVLGGCGHSYKSARALARDACNASNLSGAGDPYVPSGTRKIDLTKALHLANGAATKNARWAPLLADIKAIFQDEATHGFAPRRYYNFPGNDGRLPSLCTSAALSP